jgi:hypothetical protein
MAQSDILIYSVFNESQNRELYGFKNINDSVLIIAQYDLAFNFRDSVGVTMNDDGSVFLWAINGKLIKKFNQATVLCPVEEDFRAYPAMRDGQFYEGMMPLGKVTDEEEYWSAIWGCIDKNGKYIAHPNYLLFGGYNEGLAPVLAFSKDTSADGESIPKWGYVGRSGRLIIPAKYEIASHFSEGLAAVAIESDKIDSNGVPVIKWGYIDKSGKMVIEAKYDGAYRFSEGLAAVMIESDDSTKSAKWGYIDKSGKIVIEAKFDDCMPFSEGLAAIGISKYESDNSEESEEIDPDCYWGYIDKSGKLVVEAKYEAVHSFSESMAAVAVNSTPADEVEMPENLWGYIDKSGKLVVPCKWVFADQFVGGLAKTQTLDEDGRSIISVLNTKGEIVKGPIKAELFCPMTFKDDKFYRGY